MVDGAAHHVAKAVQHRPVVIVFRQFQEPFQGIALPGALGSQNFGVVFADGGNADGGEHIAHAAIPAGINGGKQIVHAVLPQPLHFHQLLPVGIQMVEVCKIPDKAPVNQQLQPLLGQPQNVHGIPADEIGNLIQPNGRTVGIDAVEHFPPIVIA